MFVMLLMRRVTASSMPPFAFDANWNDAMIVEGENPAFTP